jgi:hypothetical protein
MVPFLKNEMAQLANDLMRMLRFAQVEIMRAPADSDSAIVLAGAPSVLVARLREMATTLQALGEPLDDSVQQLLVGYDQMWAAARAAFAAEVFAVASAALA